MKRTIVFRPYPRATVALPFPARSSGHYVVSTGFQDLRRRKDFFQLFWGVRGTGRFVINGRKHPLHPGHVCLYFPGDMHDVSARDGVWEYGWLTTDSDRPVQMLEGMGLQREPFAAGPCPTPLFARLREELLDFSPAGQRQASVTVYALLMAALSGGDMPRHHLVGAYRALVADRFSDPRFGLEEAARRLSRHRSTVYRLFRKETGLAPGDYLQRYRIREALTLLKETDLPAGEIAARCGFNDANYFSRAIRRATGSSPRVFRQS